MSNTCVIQTRVDEATKTRAHKYFQERGLTMSEGLRIALNREINETQSTKFPSKRLIKNNSNLAIQELDAIFSSAENKRKIANLSGDNEPTIDSIVDFCNSVKRERINAIS